jgi:uncharacterized membrane protein
MAQSRAHSFAEVVTSTMVGYIIAICTQLVVFPLYGMKPDHGSNMEIAAIFTVVSIIRSYFFRRVWNHFDGGRHE